MERVVRESGLGWTIVRPSMIYGSELDKNVHRLLRFLDRSVATLMWDVGLADNLDNLRFGTKATAQTLLASSLLLFYPPGSSRRRRVLTPSMIRYAP
jgi:hypothetical protein